MKTYTATGNGVVAARKKKSAAIGHRRLMRTLFILSFIIIPLVHFGVFYVYVNFDSFIMAFQKAENGKIVFTGLDNFKWVFERIRHGSTVPEDNLRLAFINTFKTFGLQIVLFPIGMFVSYFIYKKIRGYRVFRVLFYLPTILSPVVVGFFYIELMSAGSFVSHIIEKLWGLDYTLSPLADTDFANFAVLLQVFWLGFPGNLIVWGGTFSRIPDSVLESARLDGVNWLQEMFRIILPLVWPTFVLMVTTSIAAVFGSTGSVFLLTGGLYDTQAVSNWMYTKVLQSTNPYRSNNLYRVSALGLMLTVLSCAVALFVRKFLSSRVEETTY